MRAAHFFGVRLHIVKQGADGRQTNTLGVQLQGDNVIFTVNGTGMTRPPKGEDPHRRVVWLQDWQ
jgi:hypothetical protein